MNSLLEAVILNALAAWFVFYMVNHAKITAKFREALLPLMPRWLAALVTCPLCLTFWALLLMGLFSGFTAMILWVPPTVLFIDCAYKRLTWHGTMVTTTQTGSNHTSITK